VVNKQAGIIRVYRPPDANCLLSVADHCLRSRQYVNVIVVGKQSALQPEGCLDQVLSSTVTIPPADMGQLYARRVAGASGSYRRR
jgi:D-xylulose 5-phosphate/D-fructose 6-phosphate phosphoketolase